MNEITLFAIMVLLIVVPIITLLGISYKTIWNNDLNYLWPNALEMGYYKQGTGVLCNIQKDEPTYCCLGVLGNILVIQGHAKWLPDRETSLYRRLVFKTEDEKDPLQGSVAFLNPECRYELGIQLHTSHLINMNDGQKKSFKEIAQYIRKNIKLKNL